MKARTIDRTTNGRSCHARAVEITIPRISPIEQPVRQWTVACVARTFSSGPAMLRFGWSPCITATVADSRVTPAGTIGLREIVARATISPSRSIERPGRAPPLPRPRTGHQPTMAVEPISLPSAASEATIQRVADRLREQNIEVLVVDTGDEARDAVLERIPLGTEVYSGKSLT